jgi:hypothetical protein
MRIGHCGVTITVHSLLRRTPTRYNLAEGSVFQANVPTRGAEGPRRVIA